MLSEVTGTCTTSHFLGWRDKEKELDLLILAKLCKWESVLSTCRQETWRNLLNKCLPTTFQDRSGWGGEGGFKPVKSMSCAPKIGGWGPWSLYGSATGNKWMTNLYVLVCMVLWHICDNWHNNMSISFIFNLTNLQTLNPHTYMKLTDTPASQMVTSIILACRFLELIMLNRDMTCVQKSTKISDSICGVLPFLHNT